MELQKRRNSALRALSRKGFTLPEILMAVLVFTMIFMGLGGIWATSHRYMFRAFRTQIIRNNITIAVRQIQTDLSLATRFDSTGQAAPEYGADAQKLYGGILAGGINVDNNYDAAANPPNQPGCYPLNADANANKPSWFVYCFAKAKDADGNDQLNLYRYTGDITGTGEGCPGSGDINKRWSFNRNVIGLECGKPFGGKELSVLMNGLTEGAFLKFTNRNDVIALHLKIDRPADAGERPISVTVDTDIKMNMVPFE